jgi:hypothetical protein
MKIDCITFVVGERNQVNKSSGKQGVMRLAFSASAEHALILLDGFPAVSSMRDTLCKTDLLLSDRILQLKDQKSDRTLLLTIYSTRQNHFWLSPNIQVYYV